MEQKGLDEIEESFLGEEIIEDEVSFMAETKTAKTAAKKAKASKATSTEKETAAKKAEKVEVVEVKQEEVTISPVEKVPEPKVDKVQKEVKVEPVAEKKTEPKVEAWGKDPTEANGSNAWAILSGVLVVLLLISVFTQGFSFGDNTALSGEEIGLSAAEELVQEYVNTNLLPDPFTAGLVSSEELNDLYRVTLTVNGQEIDSYITKSGDLFFPQGLEIEDVADTTDTELEAVDRVDVSTDDDTVKGDPNAPVTIVEFSDYECPFCGKFYDDTYALLVENYIDTGIAKLAFRDFPLSFHPEAEGAAIAAECAGEQDAYFGMHDLLFENQESLSSELYLALAEELELDLVEFNTCLDDPAMADEVAADMADGSSFGVSGTPAFFINGELISGAQPYEAFVAAIERALAELSVEEVEVEAAEEVVEEVAEVEEDVAEEETVEEVAEEVVASGETVSVELTAKKWRFTPSDVSVSVGDTVELTVVPEDLDDFTFSIADLGVEETISGETLISFTATYTGSFEYSCSSCEEWRGMTGQLVVE
tara:strand:+ start:2122 stop:3732 length:1611 start_codon:yes stop_codon:yes gene_type:complete